MNLQILLDKSGHSLANGVQLVLATTSPLQKIIDHPCVTHKFLNMQAIQIMQHDGCSEAADFFSNFQPELDHGVQWADEGWKNAGHYLRLEEKGLWRFPSAIDLFEQYTGLAIKNVRGGDVEKSVFFLGAAAHILQDVCVPHHARGKLFAGHRRYEEWVRQRYAQYCTLSGGVYFGSKRREILLKNAAASADLLSLVNSGNSDAYHKATQILLPLAQQTTAGLLLFFFEQVVKHANLTLVNAA